MAVTGDVGGSRILVIEDDHAVGRVLRDVLTQEGHQVTVATDGAQAEALLEEVQPDLVLLDIILPDIDGLVLCSQMRPRWQMPIILISASKRRADRTLGLRLGADDFIPKPFDIYELVARVEAVLRRASTSRLATGEQRVGPLVIDRSRHLAQVGSQSLPLTPTEFRLLAALASRANEVVTRNELAEAVWGFGDIGQSRAVDVHVRRLRQKLEILDGVSPQVATVRGFGYKLLREAATA
ncbi:MAG: response regulator transcription factor [Chloroflexi bacterium]|nr:response regulator transcription factor [Chloroflexota bacterium]